MKTKIFFYCCITLFFLFSFPNASIGQKKINFSIGFGLPELANVGVRYKIGQTQIGLNVGTIPSQKSKSLSVSGGLFLHFGNLTELSNLKPWYIMVGLAHLYNRSVFDNNTTYKIQNSLVLTTMIGKEFNISKKVGLYFNLGVITLLSQSSRDNLPKPTEPMCCQGGGYDYPIMPVIGFGIFFK